jgi:hypothetical protein
MSWIRSHMQPVLLFLGAVALALKPFIVGTSDYGITGWISVAILIAGAAQTYIAPNVEGSAGVQVKNAIAILAAGLAAALNVAPNGFSRADLWTVGAAVVAVGAPLLFPNTQPKAVLPGSGAMGDTA